MVTHTGKILHTAAANHHDRVLLQIVALSGDVAVHLLTVGEADTRHLSHGGVRLLGGGGVNTHAHAATLGTRIQCRRFALVFENRTPFSY